MHEKHLRIFVLILTLGISVSASGEEKHAVAAVGETLFSNAALFSVSRFVADTDFTRVSPDTMWTNMTSPWQFDQSQFQTNQIGHPYQGSTYFAAGRTNGFNFYESIAFAPLGSVTWEFFCERSTPGMNDLITTTMGGASLGEIFHRLYLETSPKNPVAAVFISPIDAFDDAVRRSPPEPTGGKITAATLSAGLGFVHAREAVGSGGPEGADDPYVARNPGGAVAFALVYGDPFANDSNTPFDHFDLDLRLVGAFPWYGATLWTDGYLMSRAIADGPSRNATAGLSLHYDFVMLKDLQISGTSIDATTKQRWQTSFGSLSLQAHAGVLGFGSANFYPEGNGDTRYKQISTRDYGSGLHAKLRLEADFGKAGAAELSTACFAMLTYPDVVRDSGGAVLCAVTNAAYSIPVAKALSVELRDEFSWQAGMYDEASDVAMRANEATVGVKIRLK